MSETNIVKVDEKSAQLGKAIEYGEGGIVIRTVDDLKNLAKWAVESGFLPEQIRTAQQAFVIMVSGAELGLKPMAATKFLYLTKARRVALMTKGALAVVQSKPTYDGYREWIEGEGREMKACAWAKRKGQEGLTKEFTYLDAEVAGLLKERRTREGTSYDSTYQSYLKDMLLSRARGRVLDIVFAAELGGIPIEGVAEDIDMMARRQAGEQYREPQPSVVPKASGPDPLLKMIEQQKPRDVVELDPADVKIIEEQIDEIFPREEQGPPPVLQPKPGNPKGEPNTLVGNKGGRGTTSSKGPDLGGGIKLCPRCQFGLNLMGGCDICGYPGEDIR